MIIYDIILLLLIVTLLWWFFSFIVIPSIVNFFKKKNYKIRRVMLSEPRRLSHPELYEVTQQLNYGLLHKMHVFTEKFDTKEKAQKFIDKQINNEMTKNKVEFKERITKHIFLENSLNIKKKKKWWKLF